LSAIFECWSLNSKKVLGSSQSLGVEFTTTRLLRISRRACPIESSIRTFSFSVCPPCRPLCIFAWQFLSEDFTSSASHSKRPQVTIPPLLHQLGCSKDADCMFYLSRCRQKTPLTPAAPSCLLPVSYARFCGLTLWRDHSVSLPSVQRFPRLPRPLLHL
jgi:hypothetical protein